jgi:hypothetical protein
MPENPPSYMAQSKIDLREARFSIDRYLKENNQPLSKSNYQLKKLYYPFWHIEAVLLKLRKNSVTRVLVDDNQYGDEVTFEQTKTNISLSPYVTSVAAGSDFDGLPKSIGMRGEYIKLTTLSDDKIEDDFDTLPVVISWDEVRKNLNNNVELIKGIDTDRFNSNITEVYCPKASLIYLSYYVFDYYNKGDFDRFVVDAVTGRMVEQINEPNLDNSKKYSRKIKLEPGALKVEPHLCNECGESLPQMSSYIYVCNNCETLINLDQTASGIEKLYTATENIDEFDKMVPFWVIKIEDSKDMGLKQIFGGIHHSDCLVLPAFKMKNFNAMLKLTKRMSAAYPRFSMNELYKVKSNFLPVNVTVSDALNYAKIFIRHEELDNKSFKSSEVNIPNFNNARLFYVPFNLENYFYIDSILEAVTLEKSLIP